MRCELLLDFSGDALAKSSLGVFTAVGNTQARSEKIEALSISLTAKAGEEGKLFGSVTVRDISEAIVGQGVEVEKSEIRLPDGPIRELGEFDINIHLHPEVDSILKLTVVAEA